MDVVFIDHARERLHERGGTEQEVRETLRSGRPTDAKGGRHARELVFPYNAEWQGRHYREKKVLAVYVEERERLVILTVYVYYGEWT